MATSYYIGADVDSKMTELAIEKKEKILRRYRVPTTIPALREVLGSIPSTRFLTFEEGPMAGWLYRNLKDNVDDLIVCDPRRNKLIACDGDKNDSIDAGKLARLFSSSGSVYITIRFVRPFGRSIRFVRVAGRMEFVYHGVHCAIRFFVVSG